MRTIQEINERIKKGKVVVLTAEELIHLVAEKGEKEVHGVKRISILIQGIAQDWLVVKLVLHYID